RRHAPRRRERPQHARRAAPGEAPRDGAFRGRRRRDIEGKSPPPPSPASPSGERRGGSGGADDRRRERAVLGQQVTELLPGLREPLGDDVTQRDSLNVRHIPPWSPVTRAWALGPPGARTPPAPRRAPRPGRPISSS